MRKLTVAGIGPGNLEQMTAACRKSLEEAEVIVGYAGYIELVKRWFPNKTLVDTPMRQEADRCRAALSLASEGKDVCLVCSGDSGVYGMAGLVLELCGDYPDVSVAILPGVTAALGGAALLGAPLGHDFAVISLSDLLTPWNVIEKRLRAASQADFVICLYNPGSKSRRDHLRKACDILMAHKAPETTCGVARNIGRENETFSIMPLKELRDTPADMFTTVFVGNSRTRQVAGRMVTPRGYRDV